MKNIANKFLRFTNICLSAVIAFLGMGCKTQKTANPDTTADPQPAPTPRVTRPTRSEKQTEPIKCLYGVPVTMYQIRGQVVDSDNQPLGHIMVRAKVDNMTLGEVVTNEYGNFRVGYPERMGKYGDIPVTLHFIDISGEYQNDSIQVNTNVEKDGFTTNVTADVIKQLKKNPKK